MSIDTVVITDSTVVVKNEPLIVKIGTPRTSVNIEPDLGLTQVSLSDAYQVVPYAKRITLDYDLPDSITQGLFIDVDDLRNDLLKEIGDREIAIIDTTAYAKNYADGVETQVYTNINAEYIGAVTGYAYAIKSELTNLVLEYDTATGTQTATLQDIYSSGVATANAQAGYDVNLQAVVDNNSALATRTTTLEASVEGDTGLNARVQTIEGVAAGEFPVWDLDPASLLIGMVKYTDAAGTTTRENSTDIQTGDAMFQYAGGTLGEFSDGWVRADTAFLTNGWLGGASSLTTGPNGEITGWSYADGTNTTSTFSINADNFYVQNSLNDITTRPFSIEGNDIRFNGIVTFGNVTDTGNILQTGDAAGDINSNVTKINGGLIETNTIKALQIDANAVNASHIAANSVSTSEISSDYVYAGYISADRIDAGELNVDRITSGSLSTTTVITSGSRSFTTTNSNGTGQLVSLHLYAPAFYQDLVIFKNGLVWVFVTPAQGNYGYTYNMTAFDTPGNHTYDVRTYQGGRVDIGTFSIVQFKK